MKELVLVDIEYHKGGHNKIYADSILAGIGDTFSRIEPVFTKKTKFTVMRYLFRLFNYRDVHLHFLYIEPLLKYFYCLYPVLFFLKKFNRISLTCTYHVFCKNELMNSVSGLFDGIVVHSDLAFDYLIEKSKIRVINYPSFFNLRPSKRVNPDRLRFGFLGGNRPEKRYSLLIQAVNKCVHDIEVVIGGANTDPAANGMIITKDHRIVPRYLSDEELKEMIKYIDVLVLPYSKEFCGQSGPLVEAAYAGKVIIASGAPVLKQTVQRYRLGEIFEGDTAESLLHSIDRVIADYCKYNVENCFREDFSQERFLENYRDFFAGFFTTGIQLNPD